MDASGLPSLNPRRRARLWVIGVLVGVLLLWGVGLSPGITTPLERWEWAAHDTLFRLRGPRPPQAPIAIVAIDDAALNWVGERWPWKRETLAHLLLAIAETQPRAVALDLLLTEPAPGDDVLVQSLDRFPYAVGLVHIFQTPYTVTLEAPPFAQAFDALGVAAFPLEADAHLRTALVYQTFDGNRYWHEAVLLAQYLSGDPNAPHLEGGVLHLGERSIPVLPGAPGQVRVSVDFLGPSGTIPTYSAVDLLAGERPPLAGKVVLVGVTSPTLHDVYPTPFDPALPGVEAVAQLVDTLLYGKPPRALPPWAQFLVLLLLAGVSDYWARHPSPTRSLLGLAGSLVIYSGVMYGAFLLWGVQAPWILPWLLLILGVLLPTVEQAVYQEREKRRLRRLFTRFLAPEMVEQLLTTTDPRNLNRRATITVLFSDIRNFTALSERLRPEEVVAWLNPYLSRMTHILHAHRGTVDKYEGDAILAFFGQPLPDSEHALHAVQAALAMREALAEIKRAFQADPRFAHLDFSAFDMGIGIHTGEAFVGLLGSEQRLEYTVIGDTVNTAVRVQDLTKTVGWPILITESTYRLLAERLEVLPAGEHRLKGKREPVRLYKVVRLKE